MTPALRRKAPVADPALLKLADSIDHQPEAPGPAVERLLWGWPEVLAATGIPRRTLEREIAAGRFPKPIRRVGRRRFFRPADIIRWSGGGRPDDHPLVLPTSLRRLLVGHDLNGELDALPEPWKKMGEHLAGLSKKARPTAWQAMMAARPDHDELVKALTDVDPLGPPPAIATAAPVRDPGRCRQDRRRRQPWLWKVWMALGRLNAVAADPGDRQDPVRLGSGPPPPVRLAWPDGQPATLPAGTRTLWCSRGSALHVRWWSRPRFGLPDEAVALGSAPDEPFEGLDLDRPTDTPAAIGRPQSSRRRPDWPLSTPEYATSRNLARDQTKALEFSPRSWFPKDRSLHRFDPLVCEQESPRETNQGGGTGWYHDDPVPDPEGQPRPPPSLGGEVLREEAPGPGSDDGDRGKHFDFEPPRRA